MSNLTEHAKRELAEAGWFKTLAEDPDALYDGMIGKAVMELVEKFSEQGHSGMSASITLALFGKVANWGILQPMKNPMETGEYMDVAYLSSKGKPMYQSTRKSSVFSNDGGKTWYDIDKKVPWWKKLFGARFVYVTFPKETK